MLGGSMRMPGLQTFLIELTGKEIRRRLSGDEHDRV